MDHSPSVYYIIEILMPIATSRLLVGLVFLIAIMCVTIVPVSQAKSEPVHNWATLTGQVLWPNDKAIPHEPIKVTADRKACGELFDQSVIVDEKTRGLKNVVVWLRPDDTVRGNHFPKDRIHPSLQKVKATKHSISSTRCQYSPRIVALRVDDTLAFPSDKTINHSPNVSSEHYSKTLPPNDEYHTKPIEYQSSPISFACNIHPWMRGYARVFDHPYFTVTDDEGKFTIEKVPVGNWRIVYWHETGYQRGREGGLGEVIEVKQGDNKVSPNDFVTRTQS